MEGGRMRKYGHASPERSKARSEPPSKSYHHHHHPQQQQSQQARRVPVVYYLCRNRHLEHPHFIEVPTSSPEGLCLRDVITRLNVLRGKGMAAMYSWSCKRSYKNGFVWHDLCEDDLILPTSGNEYVLKGSELLDASPSDRSSRHAAGNSRSQASKRPLQESPSPPSSRSQDESPSSSGVVIPEVKAPPPQLLQPPPSPVLPPPVAPAPDDEHSPQETSPKSKLSPASGAGGSSPPASDYRVHTAIGAMDASTQTEEAAGASRRARQPRGTRAVAVFTEERPLDLELEDHRRNREATTPPRPKTSSEISRDEISPPPPSSPSCGVKTETLESLIRAEAQKMNSFRILEEEELLAHTGTKLRATNVFMQLITCGSLSVKGHHSFGLAPTYKARFSHANYPSPPYSSSVMLGELNYPSKNSRMMGSRMEKECYSGTMVEIRKHKEGGEEQMPTVQHPSSYNAERSFKSPEPLGDKDKLSDSARSKCLHRTVKAAARKQSKTETVTSPLSDGSRGSSAETHCCECASLDSPNECSKRVTAHASSTRGSSMRLESFQKDKEKVIKIEERLTSGARVIIQSRAPCEDSDSP
ncbi:hypothetical protein Taro_045616 [Colocasia esculenta]|uniref:SOSEKI DIX-like domain-containing protein n=1 Tax=Colocasia esculenta TaxID=4460 RepID=A0A843WX05_COLES|nr:hypothetical protein [Colocasia esculenta]